MGEQEEPPQFEYEIFASFCQEDVSRVEEVVDVLSSLGYRCFLADRVSVPTGNLVSILESSQCYFYFEGGSGTAAYTLEGEIAYAVEKRKEIFCVALPGVPRKDAIEAASNRNVALRAKTWFEASGVDFTTRVAEMLQGKGISPTLRPLMYSEHDERIGRVFENVSEPYLKGGYRLVTSMLSDLLGHMQTLEDFHMLSRHLKNLDDRLAYVLEILGRRGSEPGRVGGGMRDPSLLEFSEESGFSEVGKAECEIDFMDAMEDLRNEILSKVNSENSVMFPNGKNRACRDFLLGRFSMVVNSDIDEMLVSRFCSFLNRDPAQGFLLEEYPVMKKDIRSFTDETNLIIRKFWRRIRNQFGDFFADAPNPSELEISVNDLETGSVKAEDLINGSILEKLLGSQPQYRKTPEISPPFLTI